MRLPRKPRRRRRPEEAEAEILAAAERFLRSRPFRELQVADLMDETGLRRSSFYRYFRDRHELIVRLIDKFAAELARTNELWFNAGQDPISSVRAGYEGIGRFWAEHGPVMRAIADAAIHDREVEKAHRKFVERIVRGTAQRIRADIRKRRIPPLDARATAEALILMSERYLNDKLGDGRRAWRPAVDTLVTIWQRALYGATS